MRRYIEFIQQYRWIVILFIALATLFFQWKGGALTVIIDPNSIVPRSHPFVATTLKVEEVFGSRYVAVIGITPKNGDVFQTKVLEKVQRITQKLRETPRIVKTNLLSVAARRAKDIRGNAEGMEVKQMMTNVPTTPEGMAALKDALQRNTAYLNSTVSSDWKTITVLAEVRDAKPEEKKKGMGGFGFVANKISEIADAERDETVDIAVTGYPAFLGMIEQVSKRMKWLLYAAIVIIGLIHYEAFRTLQGLILPLITPLAAVEWGKGLMGLADVPLDIFNMSTPILILAVGAGHAVQMLKRYYEEYHQLNPNPEPMPGLPRIVQTEGANKLIWLGIAILLALPWAAYAFEIPSLYPFFKGIGEKISALLPTLISNAKLSELVWMYFRVGLATLPWAYCYWYRPLKATSPRAVQASRQAVTESVAKIGPVMITAAIVAACGFFSLYIFDIISIKVFGIFSGVGILSILAVELTLIPALRSVLPPPAEKEARMEKEERLWDRLTNFYADTILGPNRNRVFIIAGIAVLAAVLGIGRLQVESSLKKYFDPNLPLLQADAKLNQRMAGTNNIYLLIEGDKPDAIKDPAVLKAMDELQTFVSKQPNIGKVMSLAEFIKRMNQSMNGDDPAYFKIPDKKETIAEYLLLYSMSGEPGDFDPYVDYDYQLANMVVFTHSDSTLEMRKLWDKVQAFVAEKFPKNIKVSIGGSVAQSAAITEVIVKDKILNIVQIASVVFLIASLIFRSFAAGLLVITPLLLSVVVNVGLMSLLGLRLNVPTALTSALAIGIGADYAIYILFRLREEFAKGTEENQAFRNVLRTAGKACLFVASAVAGGYAVQATSRGYYPHTWNALLIGTAMLVSVTAALTVMPALVLKFRPKFIYNGASMKLSPAPAAASTVASTLAALAIGALLFTAAPPQAHALSAVEIMEKNFVVAKLTDSVTETTMTLTNKGGKQRVRKTFGTSKLQGNGLDNMRMTRFLEPTDVKGTVSLLIEHTEKDDDIWIYLPSVKKVRRLVSSNKKDSFVGTDFSYGDVIGHKVKEWNHTLVKEEAIDGKPCYMIESTPRDATIKNNTGYSKRVTWIQKDNLVTLKAHMYDEAGEFLKELRYADWKLAEPDKGRWQALRLEAKNAQTEHQTVIELGSSKVNQGVKEDFFTTRYMEQE
jgi:uncharacterized protein